MTLAVSPFLGTYTTTLGASGAAASVLYEQETTHAAVTNAFTQNISVIYDVFSRPVNSDGTSDPALSAADVTNVMNAFSNLYNLAQGTSTINVQTNGAGAQQKFFLTQDMVESLDLIVRSFQATGASSPNTSLSLDQLQRWKDFTLLTPAVQDALNAALQAAVSTRSLQSIIEMDYVDTGNTLITNKLTDLESAITITKGVLDLLADIQNVKNNVTTIQRSLNPLPFSVGTLSTHFRQSYILAPDGVTQIPTPVLIAITDDSANLAYQSLFQAQNSVFFNSPQFPVPPDSIMIYFDQSTQTNRTLAERPYEINLFPDGLTSTGLVLFDKLLSYKRQLSAFVPQIFEALGSTAAAEQNSLYNRAKSVLDGLKAAFVGGRVQGNINDPVTQAEDIASTSFSWGGVNGNKALALYRWITDTPQIDVGARVPGSTLAAGDLQTGLTNAITSAEGLNDTQKEAVRNFLFIFEEFYKSASAALQRISQMIEKMAGNISR